MIKQVFLCPKHILVAYRHLLSVGYHYVGISSEEVLLLTGFPNDRFEDQFMSLQHVKLLPSPYYQRNVELPADVVEKLAPLGIVPGNSIRNVLVLFGWSSLT